MVNVYDHVVKTWHIEDAILMGDFNAGCSYVKYFDDIALATDHRFYWLTTDNMDTTTSNSDCAYDRFVVAGSNMLKAVVPGSTSVLHYDQIYDLTEEEVMLREPLLFKVYLSSFLTILTVKTIAGKC